MAKRLKHIYPQIMDFQNLLISARKAQKGKRYRESTLAFNFDLEHNLLHLQDELKNKTYEPGPYKDFIIADSKKRLISAAPYSDRVLHHAIINIIEPPLDKAFIFDSYACRKGKGTHKALFRFREFFKRYKYVLKCDIRKYFQSMDHEILMEKLERKIGDNDALWLLGKIIASRDFNKIAPTFYYPGDDLMTSALRRRGIPVGNLTSQFFANAYLDGFDHWLKEDLQVGQYLRYVDDWCVFANDKTKLNDTLAAMKEYLAGLRLSLHPGKSRIYTAKEGVEFLGFRHLPDRVRVRKENTKRFKARMKKLQQEYAERKIPLQRVRQSIGSWIAHASYADSYELRKQMIPSFTFV